MYPLMPTAQFVNVVLSNPAKSGAPTQGPKGTKSFLGATVLTIDNWGRPRRLDVLPSYPQAKLRAPNTLPSPDLARSVIIADTKGSAALLNHIHHFAYVRSPLMAALDQLVAPPSFLVRRTEKLSWLKRPDLLVLAAMTLLLKAPFRLKNGWEAFRAVCELRKGYTDLLLARKIYERAIAMQGSSFDRENLLNLFRAEASSKLKATSTDYTHWSNIAYQELAAALTDLSGNKDEAINFTCEKLSAAAQPHLAGLAFEKGQMVKMLETEANTIPLDGLHIAYSFAKQGKAGSWFSLSGYEAESPIGAKIAQIR